MTLPVAPVVMPSELSGKSNGELPAEILYSIVCGFLLLNASIAFRLMNAEATAAGYPLTASTANNTYRKLSVQEVYWHERYDHVPRLTRVVWYRGLPWWRKPGATTAAIPGTSYHGWGLAIDIVGVEGGRLEWLLANAARFGFTWEIQTEAWHMRYVLGDELPAIALPPVPPEPVEPVPTPPAPSPSQKDFDVSTTVYNPVERPNQPLHNPVYDFMWLRANNEEVAQGYVVLSQVFLRQYVRDDPPRDKIVLVWFAGAPLPVSVPANGTSVAVDVLAAGLCSVGEHIEGVLSDSAVGILVEARETIVPQ